MIESIMAALAIHLGTKVIDHFWNSNKSEGFFAINSAGNMEQLSWDEGRPSVSKEFTTNPYQASELVVGDIYIPDSITDLLSGNEIPLVLIVEETQQQVFLLEADINEGYEISLPHGIYSFYIFLMDSNADDFFDAEIFAIGFPSTIDLSKVEDFSLEDHDDIWNIIHTSPLEITYGGPYFLDFILIDTDMIPGFTRYFSDFLEDEENIKITNQIYNLTGSWKLEEIYDFGSTTSVAYLVQAGNKVIGQIMIFDIMDDGTEQVIQESVSGSVQGNNFFLYGTDIKIIKGKSGDYFIDEWEGVILNNNEIAGSSEDKAGTTGEFIMLRSS